MYHHFIIATLSFVTFNMVYTSSSLMNITDLRVIYGLYKMFTNTLSMLWAYGFLYHYGIECIDPSTVSTPVMEWSMAGVSTSLALELILTQVFIMIGNLTKLSHRNQVNMYAVLGWCCYVGMIECLHHSNAALAVSGMAMYILLDPFPDCFIDLPREQHFKSYALTMMALVRIPALACMLCAIFHPRSTFPMRLYGAFTSYGIVNVEAWWVKTIY